MRRKVDSKTMTRREQNIWDACYGAAWANTELVALHVRSGAVQVDQTHFLTRVDEAARLADDAVRTARKLKD